MKINPINYNYSITNYKNNTKFNQISEDIKSENNIYNGEIKYPQIYFGSNLSTKKIPYETNKLIKLLDECLEQNEDYSNITDQEYMEMMFDKLNKFYDRRDRQVEMLQLRIEELDSSRQTIVQKAKEARELLKEINKLRKEIFNPHKFDKKVNVDETIDLVLINKFKSALLSDNFNLRKVFTNHYSGLDDIETLDELKQKYPKIPIPKRPEDVIAKKITDTFTRDFYLDLDELIETKAPKEKIADFLGENINYKIRAICDLKPELQNEKTLLKLSIATAERIISQYDKMKKNGTFSYIPVERNNKSLEVYEIDLKLLSIDYDKYVLNVLKEQYLNFKKTSDVVYSEDNITIEGSELKNSAYKFEKIPEKIKKIILLGEKIETIQRNYNLYDAEDFTKRLEFYAEKYGNNEEILEKIISFHSCKFTKEDMKQLSAFLSELDKTWDGTQTLNDTVKIINKNDYRPKGTEIIKEIEYQQTIAKFKEEQKYIAQLRNKQELFDYAINTLYENNLSYCAEICSKFRPKSLDDENILHSDFITKTINEHVQNKTIDKLQTIFIRWNTYIETLKSSEKDEILLKAQEFARDKRTNQIDPLKAGQYILNCRIVENFDESIKYIKEPELIRKIIENSDNKYKAVEYICKLDDLGIEDRKSMLKMLALFDIKNPVEKIILKYLTENSYKNSDTTAHPIINNREIEEIVVTISSKAKEEIYDYYKFPKCIYYYREFEEAMTKFADDKNSSGIKDLSVVNTKKAGEYELKIKGHDDRLYSYNNTYYFEEFSPIGLHKKKRI